MLVDFHQQRSFEWTLNIGNVSQAILGADFLGHLSLIVDVKGQRLVYPLNTILSTARPVLIDTLQAVIHKDHL